MILNSIVPTDQEAKLLEFIRSSQYQEITLRVSNGTVTLLEATQTLSPQANLGTVPFGTPYQNIHAVVENGHQIKVTRTIKEKI